MQKKAILPWDLLSKCRVELLRHVVVLVRDALGPELEDEVGVSLAVDVHRVEVFGLYNVYPNKNV